MIFIFCISFERKTEFVQSKVRLNLFLVKNPPKKNSFSKMFYKYTSDTKYFLDNREDPGGFLSEEISMYDHEAKLATFFISKCENDTTKTSGILSFYNKPGSSDIVLYKCD